MRLIKRRVQDGFLLFRVQLTKGADVRDNETSAQRKDCEQRRDALASR